MGVVFFIWAKRNYAADIYSFTGFNFFRFYATIPVSAWIIGPIGSLLGYLIGCLIDQSCGVLDHEASEEELIDDLVINA